MLNPIYFLMYSTGEKINITQIEGQFPQAPFPTREEREEFVKDWIQVPDEKFKQYLLDWEPRGEQSNPYYPTVEMSCRHRRLAREDALHRRRPRDVRRSVVISPEASLSHTQLPELHLGRCRDRHGRSRTDAGHQEEPDPGSGHQHEKRHDDAPTRSPRRTTGRKDFPSSKRSSSTRITNSRGGTTRVFPRRSPLHELGLGLRCRRL